MAILIAEGFDDGVMRGAADGDDPAALSTANPRTGTRHIRCTVDTSQTGWYDPPAFASSSSGRFYVGFCVEALPQSTFYEVFNLRDSVGVTSHLVIDLLTTGKFRLRRDVANRGLSSLPILASGTFTLTPGTYVGLCLEWGIDDSSGNFKMYVNGSITPDISFTGDTRNGGTASVDYVRMGSLDANNSPTGATNFDFDDLVAQDNTGAAPENAFLGDIEVAYTFPTGDGDINDWTIGGGTPAATDWESVNEVPADEDTTTIESNVVGDISRFVYGTVPTTDGPIYCVIPLLRGKKALAGTRIVQATTTDGVNTVNGVDQPLGTDYVSWQPTVWHRQQDGTTAWTAAQINASSFGPELTT